MAALELHAVALVSERPQVLLKSVSTLYVHESRRRKRGVECRAVFCIQGVHLDQIKSWFQSRFEDRKRLIEIDDSETDNQAATQDSQFDLDLAVVLAGFAFEVYNSPPENVGTVETDGYKCETTYLSSELLRELYQGQLTVKLERAINLPGLDLWGTSDPYVWLRVGDCAKQSKTCWATKDPVWNETLTINVSDPSSQSLQVAVWDANLVTFHKRLGNYQVPLTDLCDGATHELEMQLEGMGGGGVLHLKVSYKTFEEIEKERKQWEVPFLSDLIRGGLGPVLTSILGSEGIKVQDFVGSTIGSRQLLSSLLQEHSPSETTEVPPTDTAALPPVQTESLEKNASGIDIFRSFTDGIDGMKQYLGGFEAKGVSLPSLQWNVPDQEALDKSGLELQAQAHACYVEKGLASPDDEKTPGEPETSLSPVSDVKKTVLSVSGQVEELLGSWLMFATPLLRQENIPAAADTSAETSEEASGLDKAKREEMREMFKRAETAMEAWAILATSLGRTSFVKSEFEKICFLESRNTDTQLAVWRDVRGRRLVVAFRGTEQTSWRDLATDLMLVPTGFNPERVADGDSDGETLVHTGFLTAYDSVRARLLSIIKASTAGRETETDEETTTTSKWHIYMTGHSLGGALATLLAMDLSQTQMFKKNEVELSMYNFGSPRVGNRAFAENYNQVIKDSWRIVNRRDIIPTVPRLMGYCHVAHPIYLSSLEGGDGLTDDVIGEATPVAIVGEFLKGEKQLVNRLLQTEITMLRALRDGTALMQHMEDFYYISLLERVSARYKSVKTMSV